jgi:proteic killer suppression protein
MPSSERLNSGLHATAAVRCARIWVLEILRVPPANRLEALRGSRSGQHSIRINDQWRLRLVWMDGDAINVEIVDYH